MGASDSVLETALTAPRNTGALLETCEIHSLQLLVELPHSSFCAERRRTRLRKGISPQHARPLYASNDGTAEWGLTR
jgi:hypothetical protein